MPQMDTDETQIRHDCPAQFTHSIPGKAGSMLSNAFRSIQMGGRPQNIKISNRTEQKNAKQFINDNVMKVTYQKSELQKG
jgi:hypothetical protein